MLNVLQRYKSAYEFAIIHIRLNSSLSKYSFVDATIQDLQQLKDHNLTAKDKSIHELTQTLLKDQQIIKHIQKLDIQESWFTNLQNPANKTPITKYKSNLNYLSLLYSSALSSLRDIVKGEEGKETIANNNNNTKTKQWPISYLLNLSLAIGVMDMQIWQKLIAKALKHLREQISEEEKYKILKDIDRLLKERFGTNFKYGKGSFLFRQNWMADIFPIKLLIVSFFPGERTNLSILQHTQKQQKTYLQSKQPIIKPTIKEYNNLAMKMMIILTLARRIDISKQQLQLIITKIQPLLFHTRNMSLSIQTLSIFVHFLSFSNYTKYASLDQLHNQIAAKLQPYLLNNGQPQEEKEQIVSRLMRSFSMSGKIGAQIEAIRKWMMWRIAQNNNSHHLGKYIQFLISAGSQDYELLIALIKASQQNSLVQKPYMHIAKHYLSCKHQSIISSSFQCSQHPLIVKLLQNTKKYSQCMGRVKGQDGDSVGGDSVSDSVSAQHDHNVLSPDLIREDNVVERWWLKQIQLSTHILKEKYSRVEMHVNMPFCRFELDCILIVDNQPVIFQIMGMHYLKQEETSEGKTIEVSNKKMMKWTILKAYKLKVIEINTSLDEVIIIMRLKSTPSAIKYIVNAVENALKS